MYKVKITIIKKICHYDLVKQYENEISNPCPYEIGDNYIFDGENIPKGICPSAWLNIYPYALALSAGGTNFYNGWLKNKNQALVACNDGIRPVTFLLETIKD